jgi:MoaA/NifB/PqqE/SkfB family radical SAM enzyme
MKKIKSKKILFGVSITVTKNNLNYVTAEPFMDFLCDNGCSVAFYVEYVSADENSYDIVPSDEDRKYLLQKLDSLRETKPIITIAFPGDEKDMGGCLAAGRGFFHINSNGSAEPCPFSPYSDMSLNNCSLLEALESPLFKKLQNSELLESYHGGGCVLFENAKLVKQMSTIQHKDTI